MATEANGRDRILFRAAGWAAIAFVVVGVPAQILHPLPEADVPTSFLEEINAAKGYWTAIHLLTLASALLSLVVFVALARSLRGEGPRILGLFAAVFAVVGTAFVFSWVAIDGVAMTHIAEDWEAAAGAEKETAFRVANAVEDVIFAYFSLAWVIWFGLPIALLGIAVTLDRAAAAWAGPLGAVLGSAAVLVGLVQVYTFREFIVTDVLIPITGLTAGLWLVGMGLWLWKRAPTPGAEFRSPARSEAR